MSGLRTGPPAALRHMDDEQGLPSNWEQEPVGAENASMVCSRGEPSVPHSQLLWFRRG